MKPRRRCLGLKPHYVLLLLLLGTAVQRGCCSYVGETKEGAKQEVPEQLTTEDEKQRDARDIDETTISGITVETRRSFKRGKTTVSPRGAFSRHRIMRWGAGALLGIVLLYVVMAEKRIAGAAAAMAKERQQTLLAVDQKDEVNRSAQREDAYAKVAKEELEALEQQEKTAQEKLEALARRRAEITSQAATASEAEDSRLASYDEAIEAAEERLRKAKKVRDEVKSEVDILEVMRSLTEDSAPAFLERLRLEKEALDAEDRMCGASLDDLKAVDSPKKAASVARAQLTILQEVLTKSREEVNQLEANAAAAREKAASAKEALEAQLDSLRAKKQELKKLENQENKMAKELAELDKMVFSPIRRQQKALTAQLESLTDNFIYKQQGLLEVQENLLMKLVEAKEQALKETEGRAPIDPITAIETLTPAEKELLEARMELQKLEYQSFLLVDSVVFINNEAEAGRYAVARERLREVRAHLIEGVLESPEEKPDDAIGGKSASQTELQEAEEEAELAWKELSLKNGEMDLQWQSWAHLSRRLSEAREKVERCERQLAHEAEMAELRLIMPEAAAAAQIELLTDIADNQERALKRSRREANFFKPEIFQHIPVDMDPFTFNDKYILPHAEDYLTAFEKMTEALVLLRIAAFEANEEAFRQRAIEILQGEPLEVLVATAAAGRSHELQKNWVDEKRAEIEEKIASFKDQEAEAMTTIQELRSAINELANVHYLSETFPELRVKSLAFITRLEGQVRTNKKISEKLEALGQERLQEDVENIFREAAFQAKQRRERYGTDPEILQSLHEAVLKAIDTQAERLASLVTRCQDQDDDFAPPISPAELPEPVFPEGERSSRFVSAANVLGGEVFAELPLGEDEKVLGELVGITLKNFLQLGKGSKKGQNKKEQEKEEQDES